uniref:hypothetical protein n=1 Tax=Aerococcus urinaeequi TaxID=51665 RepID=UPI002430D7AD|nr:hypothetical protein [Aerococcus urinaeequi]
MATFHEVTFIPDDLLFIYPHIQAIPPKIAINSDRYIVLEACQPMTVIQRALVAIKQSVGDMLRSSDLEVF